MNNLFNPITFGAGIKGNPTGRVRFKTTDAFHEVFRPLNGCAECVHYNTKPLYCPKICPYNNSKEQSIMELLKL